MSSFNGFYNPNQAMINQLLRQKDNIDNMLNQYSQPQQPIQNIINTGVGTEFEAKVLKDNNVENINIIPNEYSIYKRDAITRDFKKQYIKESLSKVKKYYQDTISFLNTAIKKATEENQMQDIEIFKKQLECYDCRLKKINRHLIKLNDINYDINSIETFMQPDIHEKYKKKEEEFKWSF